MGFAEQKKRGGEQRSRERHQGRRERGRRTEAAGRCSEKPERFCASQLAEFLIPGQWSKLGQGLLHVACYWAAAIIWNHLLIDTWVALPSRKKGMGWSGEERKALSRRGFTGSGVARLCWQGSILCTFGSCTTHGRISAVAASPIIMLQGRNSPVWGGKNDACLLLDWSGAKGG